MKKLVLPVTFLLSLAACGQQTASKPQVTEPSAPVAGQALDLTQVTAEYQSASANLAAMLDTSNASFPADLKEGVQAFYALFGSPSGSMGQLTFNVEALTNPLAFGRQLRAQDTYVSEGKLDTGTVQLNSDGTTTKISNEPATGFVLIDASGQSELRVNWRVNGTPTTTVVSEYVGAGGHTYRVNVEVPVHASATITSRGAKRGYAELKVNYGDCFTHFGPASFDLTGWAGAEGQPVLTLNAAYAWTSSAISADLALKFTSDQHSALFDWSSDVAATTTRVGCDAKTLSVTPSDIDAALALKVDGQTLSTTLKARSLKNLTLNSEQLRVANPFKAVSGQLAATLDYNSHRTISVFGELRDGNGNLKPGDQVTVKYVQGGKLASTNLEALFTSGLPR